MLRGYRGIFLALVGLVLSGAAPPQKQAVGQQATPTPQPTVTVAPDYAPYPRIEADECYKAKDHDAADLCAQWRAAFAAEKSAGLSEWGNWISAAAAIFSALGVILVVLALKQTEKSLKAARKANEIARQDQRPWLKISLEPREQVVWRPDGHIVGGVGIVTTNIGKDVAKIVGFKHRAVMPNYLFNDDDNSTGLPSSTFQHILPKDADEFFKPFDDLPSHVSLLPGEPWSALQELDKPIDDYFVMTIGQEDRCICIVSVDVSITYLWNGHLHSSVCMFNLTLGDASNLGQPANSPTTTDVPLGWIAFPSHVSHT